DDDLKAVAVYLASLPGPSEAPDKERLHQAGEHPTGQSIYADHCAGCHGLQGQGVKGVYPPLDGNTLVTGPGGINGIRSVLLGGFPPATAGNPEPYSMPPFARQLDNAQVAAVVNYVRQSWSNRASTVTAKDVKTYR